MIAQFAIAIFVCAALPLLVVRLLAPGLFSSAAIRYSGLARRRRLAVATVAFLVFLGSAALSGIFGIPQPIFHDEYSYLLAADTFAHGRLTNPPHPMWESFETIHVNVQPTYHSIYPPAQGAVLALGQVLTGYPIVGVWLSMAAACGATCWMMQAWVPPRWAFFGAMVAAFRLVSAPYLLLSTDCPGYWSHSYWGGGVAMFGGALLFGAVGRIRRVALTSALSHGEKERRRALVAPAVILGLGCAVLANSRPFEGLVAALFGFVVVCVALIPGISATCRTWRDSFTRSLRPPLAKGEGDTSPTQCAVGPLQMGIGAELKALIATNSRVLLGANPLLAWWTTVSGILLPASAVLVPTAAFMLYYNEATTGNPLQMPYQLNLATYSKTPVFLLGELRQAPEYCHVSLQRFYLGSVRRHFIRQQTFSGFMDVAGEKLRTLWQFFCGPLLPMSMAALFTMRTWTSRFALLGCLTVLWALAHVTWLEPHYLAPVAGLFYLLAVQGARYVGASRWSRTWLGRVFAPALLAGFAVATATSVWDSARIDRSHHRHLKRAAIAEKLGRLGGRHLVLIRDRDTWMAQDWVYNAADIDGSPIVWARDSHMDQTRQLLHYFSDRRVWRLRPSGGEIEPLSENWN